MRRGSGSSRRKRRADGTAGRSSKTAPGAASEGGTSRRVRPGKPKRSAGSGRSRDAAGVSWPLGRTSLCEPRYRGTSLCRCHDTPAASRLSRRPGRAFAPASGSRDLARPRYVVAMPPDSGSGQVRVLTHCFAPWHAKEEAGHGVSPRATEAGAHAQPEGRRSAGIRGKRHRDVPRPRVRTWTCARAVTWMPGVRRPPAEADALRLGHPVAPDRATRGRRHGHRVRSSRQSQRPRAATRPARSDQAAEEARACARRATRARRRSRARNTAGVV